MKINKSVLKNLPRADSKDEEMRQMDYVHDILAGRTKEDSLRINFPTLHKLAIERANGNKNLISANIKKQIHFLEKRVSVKEMYAIAHKHSWTNFLAKKHKLYENLYVMATDEENSVKDRISSSKTLLEYMPKFEEDKTLVIEVKDGKEEFVQRLRDMQLALFKQANDKELLADAIEAEVDDGDE